MAIMLATSLAHGSMPAAHCDTPALRHQRHDTATIERLENAWTKAYLSGDTDLERCILSDDFTEILRTGEVKTLLDELALAAANRGKQLAIMESARGTVLLHGTVAVAYGTTLSRSADHSPREMRYADYYVWEPMGRWKAFFAQQTEVAKP
jgi:hypothetical protein